MGRLFAIFFAINNLRRFHIKLAQRRRVKRQFSENSKFKLLTSAEIENYSIPYNFNSTGDNLGRVEIQIESEAL